MKSKLTMTNGEKGDNGEGRGWSKSRAMNRGLMDKDNGWIEDGSEEGQGRGEQCEKAGQL